MADIGDFGGAIGDVASGILGMFGANNQNTAASNLLDQQETYNTQMADSTYQRGVADMKAAGINPMVAFQQGGDPSPTLPSYDIQNTLATGANSAKKMGDDLQDVAEGGPKKRRAQSYVEDNTKEAQVDTANQNATISAEGIPQAEEKTRQAKIRTGQEGENLKQVSAQTPAVRAESESNTAEAHNRLSKARTEAPLQKFDAYTQRFRDVADGLNSAASVLKKAPLYQKNERNVIQERYNSTGEHIGSTHTREY